MRVLVLIYEFPPVGGGGGRVAEDICRGLVQRGHEVCLLTSHLKGLPRREKREGMQVLRVPVGRRQAFKAGFIDMLGYVVSGFVPGLRLISRWKPDVMHVHFAVPSGALALPLSILTGVPYILTAHLGDVPGGVPDKTERWFKWVFPFTPPIWRAAKKVFSVGEFTRGLVWKSYAIEAPVIPNGVDLDLLNPGEIKLGEPPRIMFAGRFVMQKNPLQVVRALSQIKDIPWHCVMVGDGPLRKDVEREINEHGLIDRFTLTGWITPDEVIGWFARSDILFMPSLSEGLPVVGVQAVAMGLAVVASRVGGFIDLVEPDFNGFLLDGQNASLGVSDLRQLLMSPNMLLSFRENSRQHAEKFDIQHIVDSYETAMLDVIEKAAEA